MKLIFQFFLHIFEARQKRPRSQVHPQLSLHTYQQHTQNNNFFCYYSFMYKTTLI